MKNIRASLAVIMAFCVPGQSQSPGAGAGWDKTVEGLLSAFDKADVVALTATRGKGGAELRTRLIRDPDFPNKARFIIVEWASSLYQPILDRYIQGDDVPIVELEQVWRDQTQVASWDSPIHAEFFAAVREVNRKLPPAMRLHVLGGDSPIDWTKVHSMAEYAQFAGGAHRDESLISILRNQVLDKGEKALVIYGGGHLSRPGFPMAALPGNPGRVFVVTALAGSGPGYEQLVQGKPPERPVFISLGGAPAGEIPANQFSWGARRFVQGKEVPLFAPTVKLSDLTDAIVYYGPQAGDSEVDPEPDPAIYRGTPYGAEIERRKQILNTR